jgi:outer membrane protein TolC
VRVAGWAALGLLATLLACSLPGSVLAAGPGPLAAPASAAVPDLAAPPTFAPSPDLPAPPPAADTLHLTLEEALARAGEHNPGYRQAAMDLERNVLDRREGWLSLLPQPQIDFYNTTMAWNRQTVTEDLFGEPLEREETTTIQTSRTSQAVRLFMTLDLGEVLDFRRHDDLARAREEGVSSRLRELRAQVRRAFLDVQEQELALELEEELLEMATENRDLVRRLYGLARRDRLDLVSLELDLTEQENAVERARSELEVRRLALRDAIGDPGLGAFRIEPVELGPFDPGRLDVEALVRMARSGSPRIRQAEANLRYEERSVSAIRSRQWLPTLTVGWGTTRDGFVRGSGAFLDPNPDAAWDRNVSVALRFPDLGRYFQRQTQQYRAELGIREQQEGLRETRNELEREVRGLVHELRASARLLANQERRADLAAEQVALAREQYRLGRLSYLELLGAQEQAAEAGRQAIAARYSFERDRVALEWAVGLSVEEMLELSSAPDGDGA